MDRSAKRFATIAVDGSRLTKKRKKARLPKLEVGRLSATSLESLPSETLLQIANCLNEQDLWALSLVNRRMAVLVCQPLRNKLYDNPRSVDMCRLLLTENSLRPWASWLASRDETALHFAAAAGHIRTVGKVLCGADVA
jgi:hypothetical protein